ncbi:MAG: chemotaxis protein CheD [Candidatus Eisenbacteria bacterium]|uniref:Probable chemoreceptor glutamine deamidase CheD n=1 Tax=Eiseniibacteriota bacterium TaxID=2212470 RepID=A0A948RV01_UNCEI|nr:chemotaxis protein CheD [Candidatus Eisenbacteria bacterium]MBU2690194.1 chemotaxis protein CheD [Candidatus Eisenbacteria bacterium]
MKQVISVADMKVSATPGEELITYALGSCLGVAIYDPEAKIGGMLHVMLPQSSIDKIKASENPYMFVDTGVRELFLACYKAGAEKSRLIVKVAGGAAIHTSMGSDHFQIGKRNFIMLRKLLWKNGVMLNAHDVGGDYSRTMILNISTGELKIKGNGKISTL